MDAQAKVSAGTPNGKGNGSPEGQVVGGIAEFGNDLTTLAELQIKLGLIDTKECLEKALYPIGFVFAGLILAIGAVPVAILGIAQVVASAFRLSTGASMILTAMTVILLSAVIIAMALRNIGPSLSVFRRSREEFDRNLNWVRTVLLYSGRNVSRRRF